MQRIQRYQTNSLLRIWIEMMPVVVLDVLCVNLWNYQRNVLESHSECMRVVAQTQPHLTASRNALLPASGTARTMSAFKSLRLSRTKQSAVLQTQ